MSGHCQIITVEHVYKMLVGTGLLLHAENRSFRRNTTLPLALALKAVEVSSPSYENYLVQVQMKTHCHVKNLAPGIVLKKLKRQLMK